MKRNLEFQCNDAIWWYDKLSTHHLKLCCSQLYRMYTFHESYVLAEQVLEMREEENNCTFSINRWKRERNKAQTQQTIIKKWTFLLLFGFVESNKQFNLNDELT